MFIVHVVLKFFASGSYAIIYIYANELFPTHGRNTGIGICSMVARLGAIAGTLFNDLLVKHFFFWSRECILDDSFRRACGSISQSSCSVSHPSWLWSLSRSVQRQPASLCLKPSTMSNAWVWLCKLSVPSFPRSRWSYIVFCRSSFYQSKPLTHVEIGGPDHADEEMPLQERS